MVIFISLLTVVATYIGGTFALKFRDRLHLILGFTAGAVLGVAFFDLLPEALDLGSQSYSLASITSVIALGFVVLLLVDRFFSLHSHGAGASNKRAGVGAATLSIHSFLDGVAIGLAFKVSAAVGLVTAAAVLAHDFSDGLNTVNVVLKNRGSMKEAWRWLVVDALAPALGATSTLFFTLADDKLGLVLAVFAGFFLYIGASDILPESFHDHPTTWTTISTIIGLTVIYSVIQLAGF